MWFTRAKKNTCARARLGGTLYQNNEWRKFLSPEVLVVLHCGVDSTVEPFQRLYIWCGHLIIKTTTGEEEEEEEKEDPLKEHKKLQTETCIVQ